MAREAALQEPDAVTIVPVRPRVETSRLVLVAAGGVSLLVVAAIAPAISPVPSSTSPAGIGVVLAADALVLAAAVIAWIRQPSNPIWRLILAYFVTSFIWEIEYIPHSAAWTATLLFRDISAAVFVHLMLAFPNGRLRSRGERWLVGFVYVYAVAANALRLVFFDPPPSCVPYCYDNLITLWPNNELANLIGTVTGLLVPVIGLVVAALAWRHWRVGSQATRRALLPVVVAFPIFLVSSSISYPAEALRIAPIQALILSPFWYTASFILPVAVLIGVLRLRLARGAVASAMLELGALPTLPRLQEVLRRRLNDPELRVLRWTLHPPAWIDDDGQQVQPPGPGADRAFLVIDRGGQPVAAVDHDASLLGDPDLADTVAAAARVALDATDLRDELRAKGGNTAGLPVGDVTFLFEDLEGSTQLLELLGPRYHDVLGEARRISADVAEKHGGRVVDAVGDEVLMAFPMSSAAVATAVGIGRRMLATAWPDDLTVRFRMGIHRGRPEMTSSGYVGLDVHRAARIMAAANGGQIIASVAVLDGLGGGEGVRARPLGKYKLRGLDEPLALVAIEADGLPTEFPPLRADLMDVS